MQIIELTDKPTGLKVYVFAGQIKFVEDAQNGGTHVCFGGDMGRVVKETKEQIFKALWATPVPSPIQA
jgi:hypothetical protein